MSTDEELAKTVAEYALIPTVERAQVLSIEGSTVHVSSEFTLRQYAGETCRKQRYEAIHWVDLASGKSCCVTVNRLVDAQRLKSVSPERRYVLRGFEEGVLEIYSTTGSLVRRVETSSVHGEFCGEDAIFGRVSWDEGRGLVCYQAERRLPNPEDTPCHYEYRQSWGERMPTRIDPALFILDVNSGKVVEIPTLRAFAPASPCLVGGGDVAFIGYDAHPVKHGLHYIYNRPAKIYCWSAERREIKILFESDTLAPRSLHHVRGMLFFLTSPVGGSHFGASSLHCMDLDGSGQQVLAEELFTQWLEGIPGHVVLNHFDRSTRVALAWDWHTMSLTRVAEREGSSCAVLDVFQRVTLVLASSPSRAPVLAVNAGRGVEIVLEHVAAEEAPACSALATLEHRIYRLDDVSECIAVTPKSSNGHLVLVAHGGPNSVYPLEYNLYTALLAHHGFTVAIVNYTGSIGFSAQGIRRLEGRVGELDVADVMRALAAVERERGSFKKVFLMGGSHGGYIAAFLCGQHPERFAGCILRNPVIDLSSMVYASDIDDWAFGQMGLSYDLHHPRAPTADETALLQRHSPASLAQHVTTPTLILLGERDQRVPMFQGRTWYRWLVANGVNVRLLVFPDANHSLETATSEKCSLQAILGFLHGLI